MARSTILVSEDPKGHFGEGVASGTIKPGMCVSILAATEPDGGGRLTYVPWDGAADGEQAEVIVALENDWEGGVVTDSYTAGRRFRFYHPVPGDELQMIILNLSGTADDHAIGEKLIIQDATGKLIVTAGTPEMEPFVLLETITDPTADTLALCRYTGH